MTRWVKAIETPKNTSRWFDLDKAIHIDVAVSMVAGNELFYVKAKLGDKSEYIMGKFQTIKKAEDYVKKIVKA
jgi:hypothetical protein